MSPESQQCLGTGPILAAGYFSSKAVEPAGHPSVVPWEMGGAMALDALSQLGWIKA